MKNENKIIIRKRIEWRQWLKTHYKSENEVWIVFYKKHTKIQCMEYEEAVEEAICHGWIDSIVKSLDNEKYLRKFTPRKRRSNWSPTNIKRAKKMIKAGLVQESGMEKIEQAKENGEWNKIEENRKEIVMTKEIELALDKKSKAKSIFNKLPLSYRRNYIAWIQAAKKQTTRQKRIKEMIENLEVGKSLGLV